jgi:glucose-6-phosphate isomerase
LGTGTIAVDLSHISHFIGSDTLAAQAEAVRVAHRQLHERTGPGSQFLGWLDLPLRYDRLEFTRIKSAAEQIRQNSDALVIIGVGGSYLGARAVIEALAHPFHNLLPAGKRTGPEIYFAGKDLSGEYLNGLLQVLEGKRFSLNMISKSGTTTEPAIAFRILRDYLERRFGPQEAAKRIYVTTDPARGLLRQFAVNQGYTTFNVPDDIGGRYSVLTAVGLLPIAAAGIDIDQLMIGAADGVQAYGDPELEQNACGQYAAARQALYKSGRAVELFVSYEPALKMMGEWWKQLFGESEGKERKGLFPATAEFPTDLHSLGQYIQEGHPILFETVMKVAKARQSLTVQLDPFDLDGLNFLAGKTLHEVNRKAFEGTLLAHTDGDVPNLVVSVPQLDEYHLGQMIYFFQKACALSGYLLGVNPFDQPGVEAYKRNMFALLGKPGFESERAALERRLK